ncbi:putative tetratricopeptide-like helical domain superfamily, pentacotripeptide-repeat region of PRORP [Helianthus annuus]|nr:putative tetratricopeptide-like helical domain superfamily, pentacotripeptide-repeat region of PRORP [Helianthus annuus]KAJ0484167.1 putative tetratricopeptide-like helical domain superfamily, pentacotripeptide-repeat region of PRORP [Helianthus annuus]
MFVKLQHLDTNCIPILHPLNTSKTTNTNGKASIPLPLHRTQREFEQQLIKKHQIPPQNPSDFRKRTVFVNAKPNPDGSVETPVKEKVAVEKCRGFDGRMWLRKENLHTKCSTNVLSGNEVVKKMHTRCSTKVLSGNVVKKVNARCSTNVLSENEVKKEHTRCSTNVLNGNVVVKEVHTRCSTKVPSENEVKKVHTRCSTNALSGNEVVKKMPTKCSTKWARYGGCIPAILEALERVDDLDEAFKPWELSLSNKERTIILKEQKVWQRAMEIFVWFKRKGCYELNVIHYNIMIRILGKARKWDELEMLRDEMEKIGIESINSTYGTLIDVYSKGGIREKAMYWLDVMNTKGMEPDEVTMGIVVQMYKTAGQFEKAEEFFKKWSVDKRTPTKTEALTDHVGLSSYTYNTLIDTYGKAGRVNDASETFEQMLKEDEVASLMQKMEQFHCVPDTRTYNILISLHVKHDNIVAAKGYFKKIQEASLEPDSVTYRTLLYAFSIRHMVSEAEELVNEMDERDLEVDEFTQSSLTRMYIEAGMVEKSWLWFNRFHIQGKMSPECYSASIDAYGERGYILEAEKVFKCCQERRNPTVLEFNVMIKAYGLNKKYDDACRLIHSMNEHGVFPDKCSYNSLIQMLASADLPQKASFYLRKMRESQFVSDCVPYSAVISSFVKLGQLEMAVCLFEEMIEFNVKPDVVVYGVLINAYADAGDVEEASRYVNEMKDMGLVMNDVICNSLIKLYTRVGCLKDAEEAYYMLQKLDTGTDVYSCNCMIDLYTERSMVKPAEEIFEKLRRNGNANEFSYAMMLCMYKKIGSFDEALEMAKQMRESGLLTDLLSYNHVLGLYASDGRFKDAVTIFNEMVESGVQPNDSTFKSLGVVLMKRGVPKKAVKNLEIMWRDDHQSGVKAWLDTLNSVVGMVYFDIND